MKKLTAPIGLFLGIVAIALWILSGPRKIDAETAAEMSAAGDPAAGKVVFFAAGCESCHMSPGQSDPFRLGGGLALKTPFGAFYPPNISPDVKDGIGAWGAVDFANALLAGVSPRGEHYYPAFPYASYRMMKVADVRDLFTFLKTLPPVTGRPPPTSLGFPFSVRRGVGLWKSWYLSEPRLSDKVAPNSAWSLGRYLVEGPGHCAECHSPRDVFGGVIAGKRLAGGALPDGKGKAPDLTATGLKDWSRADIVEALSSGFTPSGDTLGGAMAAVVRNTAQLPPSYREAIAEYLKGDAK
jgi:mono/diheme cytochrome c family protein